MTIERKDGATPHGGDYMIAVWITLATGAETDKQTADGMIVSEYSADGTWLAENVMTWTPSKDAAVVETPEEKLKRLGFEIDESTETRVIFVGSKGAAVLRKKI